MTGDDIFGLAWLAVVVALFVWFCRTDYKGKCDDRARHIAELGKPMFFSHWGECEWTVPVITDGVFTAIAGNPLENCTNGGVAK